MGKRERPPPAKPRITKERVGQGYATIRAWISFSLAFIAFFVSIALLIYVIHH
jgi:hypothetical protein